MDPFRNILQACDRRMRELLLQFAKGNGGGVSLGNALKPWIGGPPSVLFPAAMGRSGVGVYAAAYDHVHSFYNPPNWAADLTYTASCGSISGNGGLYFALYDHAHRGITVFDTLYSQTFQGVHTVHSLGASLISNGIVEIGGGVNLVTREALFTFAGGLIVQAGTIRIYNRFGTDMNISEVFLSCNTPPDGSDIIVDVNINGTTIFTTTANRPRIITGSYTGLSTGMDITAFASGDYLQADIDQIGSVDSGADLTVHVIYI